MDDYKRDCFFFSNITSADVVEVTCQYDRLPGYCPCEECGFYIHKKDAADVVRNFVDKRLEETS